MVWGGCTMPHMPLSASRANQPCVPPGRPRTVRRPLALRHVGDGAIHFIWVQNHVGLNVEELSAMILVACAQSRRTGRGSILPWLNLEERNESIAENISEPSIPGPAIRSP